MLRVEFMLTTNNLNDNENKSNKNKSQISTILVYPPIQGIFWE